MKHVSDFVNFDFNAWAQGKEFEVRAVFDRKNKETGVYEGKNVKLAITKDDCKNYKLRENEESFSMTYEMIYVQCDICSAKIGQKVKFENMSATVKARPATNGAYLEVYFRTHEIK